MVSSFRGLLVISRWWGAGSDVLQEAITTSVLVLVSCERLLSFDGRLQSPPRGKEKLAHLRWLAHLVMLSLGSFRTS